MRQLAQTSLFAALSLAMAVPARAAEAPAPDATAASRGKLDTVVVEGRRVRKVASPKLTQSLADTPQTIVVIPREVFSQQAQTSLRDVLRNTSGITIQAGEGGSAPGDNIFLRGFGARNDVFIDGVRDPGVLNRDTFNIESVEVAKGPASTISGRGSTGGAINLVTKMANSTDAADFRVTAGSAGYARTTADVNSTFGETGALRLNAVWTDAGIPGRDVAKNRNKGIAPSLALGLGTPTRLYFNLSHMEQDNVPDYGLPATLPANLAAGQTIEDLDWSNFYGLKSRDHETIRSDQASVIVEHDIDDHIRLRNITRYGRNLRDTVVTPPRAATATATGGLNDPGFDPTVPQIRRTDTKYQDRVDRIFANQTNLTFDFATGAIRHAVVAGLELSREQSTSYAGADRCVPADGSVPPVSVCPGGRPPVTDLHDPDPDAAYTPEIYRTGASGRAVADDVALYAFDTVQLGERWEVSAGARRERFDVGVTSVAAPVAPAVDGVATDFQRTDDMTSWRAGVVFKPSEHASYYAAYGTSFNPSADGTQGLTLGETSTGATGPNSPTLAPEQTRAFEVGGKWTLPGNGLFLTAAIFRSDKNNAKSTDAAGNTVLDGDQRVDGFELGASGRITRNWSVFGGYVYMHGTIAESSNPLEVDKELQYVPKSSFNVWSTYQVSDRFTLGGGAQFTDGYFFNNTNTFSNPNLALIQQRTRYWLFGAMASYALSDRATLQLNVNNLTNARYVERGYTGHFTPGPTRSALLSFDYRY
jgi:catecholate siderophore receptor